MCLFVLKMKNARYVLSHVKLQGLLLSKRRKCLFLVLELGCKYQDSEYKKQ